MSEFNFNKIWKDIRQMDTSFPGYKEEDPTQEDFNNEVCGDCSIDNFEDIEPEDFEDEFDFDDSEYIEPDRSVSDEFDFEDNFEYDEPMAIPSEDEQPEEVKNDRDIIAWADTTNFVISAKRLSEFLGDVLFQPERWIGDIDGYEDYMCTGEYYILSLNSTHGLIVSLVYENIEDKGIYVTISLNEEGVNILKINEESF